MDKDYRIPIRSIGHFTPGKPEYVSQYNATMRRLLRDQGSDGAPK
jgi:hypothetical protein